MRIRRFGDHFMLRNSLGQGDQGCAPVIGRSHATKEAKYAKYKHQKNKTEPGEHLPSP